jgi:DNA-binding SARP family transcriptional activator/tetratricopeptide (TPR) repeat protein
VGNLSLSFLGSFQATLDGEHLIGFRSARVQGLLVYLAMESQRAHPRDYLAAMFWPDEPDSVAKKNLRQSIYQLRQVLKGPTVQAEPYLTVTRSTIQFNRASSHSLDVAAFLTCLENNQLDQAVTLYKGDLLPSFTCNSINFEEWLGIEREHLHHMALDAMFERTARSLAQADYLSAREFAQRQLALEPWREEAYRQLMQALALLGERSAALALFETCRTVLEEELNVEPSAETEALAARIRDQQLGQAGKQTRGRLPERRLLTIPFAGRIHEHATLTRIYQRTSNREPQVIALLGEAGIGKTRLAHNFLDWAATQGADILRGRAFETSGKLSYQALTQALRQRLERENAPEDLLSDLWLTQLTRILPELRDRYPDLPEPTLEENNARQHLFESITRLVLALANRSPVILFIDDWHWADAASLDVLHYATLRWAEEQAPILVLLTLRQEALTEAPDLQTWLTRLKHDVPCTLSYLAPLSRAETEQLIHSLLEPAGANPIELPNGLGNASRLSRFSRKLFQETDGQPFFLAETLKALIEEELLQPDENSEAWRVDWSKFDEQMSGSSSKVSPGVQELIRSWLGRISAPASQLLTAAAVLGQEATFDHLSRVTGLDEIQTLNALDEVLARQLLLEADEASQASGPEPAYSFSHQKVGEVVYNQAGAARRRMLHRRAFEVLRVSEAQAAELAYHALNAGLLAEAVQYSIAAGREALRLFAARVAASHFETAWQLAEKTSWPDSISSQDRQILYTNLGRAYELFEAWSQAQEIYQAMYTYAQTIGSKTLECEALNHLATIYINGLKDLQQATIFLEQARWVAEQSGDRRGLAETEWNLSVVERTQQNTYSALQHSEQALRMARELGEPQLLARSLNSLAYVQSLLRQWEQVETYADEARHLYAAAGNRILEADSQRLVGWCQMYAGRPQDSLATLLETCAFSQEIENLWGETECAWRLALTMLELGHYGEAISLASQAVKQAPTMGQPVMSTMAQFSWGSVQRAVIALGPARETLLNVLAECAKRDLTGYVDWSLTELCAVHVLSGEWEQAHDYARQALESRGNVARLPMTFTGWYETEALLQGGDGELARSEIAQLEKIVGNNRRYRLPLHRSRAVLAKWDGDLTQSLTHLRSARALAQEIGLPGEEWSILSAQSALYAQQGDRDQARRARQAAAVILHHLADSIDQPDMRAGFLAAGPVQEILAPASA